MFPLQSVGIGIRINSETNVRIDEGEYAGLNSPIAFKYGTIETTHGNCARTVHWQKENVNSLTVLRLVFLEDMYPRASSHASKLLSFEVDGVDILNYLEDLVKQGGIDTQNSCIALTCKSLKDIRPGDELTIGPLGLLPVFKDKIKCSSSMPATASVLVQ